jgi:hypothetical protein
MEFYHDRGALVNYATNMMLNEQNFAKSDESVRRELDKSTLEVYLIKGFGAIEIGRHKFYTTMKGSLRDSLLSKVRTDLTGEGWPMASDQGY